MGPSLVALLAAACSGAYACFTLNRLVKLQYEDHYHEWEADGRPIGFIWRAPESEWMRGTLSREWVSIMWLVGTPEWAKSSQDARHLLHHMRVAVLGSGVFVAMWVAAAGALALR